MQMAGLQILQPPKKAMNVAHSCLSFESLEESKLPDFLQDIKTHMKAVQESHKDREKISKALALVIDDIQSTSIKTQPNGCNCLNGLVNITFFLWVSSNSS